MYDGYFSFWLSTHAVLFTESQQDVVNCIIQANATFLNL